MSSRELALALAECLARVVPAGFTVSAEDTMLAVSHDGEHLGRSGAPDFLESIEGLADPVETLIRATRVALDTVQVLISDESALPWPGERSQPNPDVRLDGDRLVMWFGDEQAPVLELPPIDLSKP